VILGLLTVFNTRPTALVFVRGVRSNDVANVYRYILSALSQRGRATERPRPAGGVARILPSTIVNEKARICL